MPLKYDYFDCKRIPFHSRYPGHTNKLAADKSHLLVLYNLHPMNSSLNIAVDFVRVCSIDVNYDTIDCCIDFLVVLKEPHNVVGSAFLFASECNVKEAYRELGHTVRQILLLFEIHRPLLDTCIPVDTVKKIGKGSDKLLVQGCIVEEDQEQRLDTVYLRDMSRLFRMLVHSACDLGDLSTDDLHHTLYLEYMADKVF